MKKLFSIALSIALILLLASPAMSAVGVWKASHNLGTATDINVGNAGYFDGSTLYLGFTSIQGTSTMVSGSTAIPVAYSVVHKVIGQSGDSVGTLADGTVGQVLYIDVSSDAGAYNWVVTPTTKNGYTSFTMNATNQYVVLMFIDTTVGWIIIDHRGATIT